MAVSMDRRQRKTRESIFQAFTSLLSKKNASQITVGEIIERANVGRATFYAHFETKDFLLKELCKELFAHVFESHLGEENAHKHIFDCDAPDSVFLHLLLHLQKNDNNILELLTGENNELFLYYFKENLKELVKSQPYLFQGKKAESLPESFWINHVCSAFVETVRWWISTGMKETPSCVTKYFLLSIE
jgi:AcrR family transcriptional regulator